MNLENILDPIFYLRESIKGPQWIMPDTKALALEYKVEYMNHIRQGLGNIFPTVESFIQACHHGHPLKITKALDARVSNRSHTRNQKELLNMIRSYRSYPEFRNENTVQNLYDRMQSGEALDMPILLKKKHSDRVMVMSGNTRMDVAFQLGLEPTCLVVEYDHGLQERARRASVKERHELLESLRRDEKLKLQQRRLQSPNAEISPKVSGTPLPQKN